MANEIERKFLVIGEDWRAGARSERFRQGYVANQPNCTVRVRIAGAQAYMTLKGERQGITRLEFEYEIPVADAEQILDELCEKPLIEKVRHFVQREDALWEVDEFEGENAGLIVAEVELKSAEQHVGLPEWVGEEVSEDRRYSNSNLARFPYARWRAVG